MDAFAVSRLQMNHRIPLRYGWVYKLQLSNEGRYYVGSTIILAHRLWQHEHWLEHGTHTVSELLREYQQTQAIKDSCIKKGSQMDQLIRYQGHMYSKVTAKTRKKCRVRSAQARRIRVNGHIYVEAGLMDQIKKIAYKVLKASLPALVLFSATTGFAKVKDPEALGKKFQEIAMDIGSGDEKTPPQVKTHVLQNDPDQPQVVVYTLKAGTENQSFTIKYTEGKGARVSSGNGVSNDNMKSLADTFSQVLNSLDTVKPKK